MDNKRQAMQPMGGPPKKPYKDDMDDIIDDFCDDELPQPPEEGVDVDLGEAGRNWMRPPVPEFNPAKDSIGERNGDQIACQSASSSPGRFMTKRISLARGYENNESTGRR